MPNNRRHLHDEQRKMEAAVENRWMKAVCTCDSVMKKKMRKKNARQINHDIRQNDQTPR